MKKLTIQEYEKLSPEEKKAAILSFKEPSEIHTNKYINLKKIDKDNYK